MKWDAPNPSQNNLAHFEAVLQQAGAGYDLQRIATSFGESLLAAAVAVAAGVAANSIAHHIDLPGKHTIVAGASTSALLHPAIEPVIKNLFHSLVPISRDDVAQYQSAHKTLIQSSKNIVTEVPPFIQKAVQRIDTHVDNSLRYLSKNCTPVEEPKTISEVAAWLYIRQVFWLGQPRKRINYLETVDMGKKQATINRQPKEQRRKVDLVFTDIIAASVLGSDCGGNPLYLIWGPEGTGKSKLQLDIADALGAVLLRFYQEQLIAGDIIGPSTYSMAYDPLPSLPGVQRHFPTMRGKLRDAVVRSGVRNPLAAIDDFQFSDLERRPMMIALYNQLFDIDPPKDKDDADGLEELKDVVFFVTSNDDPNKFSPNPAIRALLSRFQILHTPPLDPETISQIVQTTTAQTQANAAAQLGLGPTEPPVPHKQRVIRPIDKDRMAAALKNATIITQNSTNRISNASKDPGARAPMRAARRIFGYALVKSYLNEVVTEDDIKFVIQCASGNR